jgi:hypothetical protein
MQYLGISGSFQDLDLGDDPAALAYAGDVSCDAGGLGGDVDDVPI